MPFIGTNLKKNEHVKATIALLKPRAHNSFLAPSVPAQLMSSVGGEGVLENL